MGSVDKGLIIDRTYRVVVQSLSKVLEILSAGTSSNDS